VAHRNGGWSWGDWGDNIDMNILDNAWYYLALKAAIPMAAMSGNAGDTAGYRTRMNSIATNFSSTFWNAGEQYFKSSSVTSPDDRANAMAVLSGLAQPQHYAGIRKVLTQRTFASPWMEKYVLEALCMIKSEDVALTRMKSRYGAMVNAGYTTLWEVWTGLKDGTINHGWNAPNTVLSQYIAGLSPTAPGWSSYSVLPQMGSLTAVSATVPSIRGTISASDSVIGNQFIMQLTSPTSTVATIGIPVRDTVKIQKVSVNGTTVWHDGSFVGGVTGVAISGQDTSFLKFTAAPGSWRFVATYSNLQTAIGNNSHISIVKDNLRLTCGRGRPVAHVACSGKFRLQIFDMSGRECVDLTGIDSKDVVLSENFTVSGTVLIRLLSSDGIIVKKAILYQ
jgi:hypothetical protein